MPTVGLALDMGFGHALSQQFKASLRQINHFTLIFLFQFRFRFDLSVCNGSDILDDVVGLSYVSNQSLILRLEQLQQGPDCDMLKSCVTRLQETAEVSVDSAVGVAPILNEN